MLEGIKGQADVYLKSRLFKVVEREFRHRTNLKLREATTTLETDRAKLLEYEWDVVETILQNIKNF